MFEKIKSLLYFDYDVPSSTIMFQRVPCTDLIFVEMNFIDFH